MVNRGALRLTDLGSDSTYEFRAGIRLGCTLSSASPPGSIEIISDFVGNSVQLTGASTPGSLADA